MFSLFSLLASAKVHCHTFYDTIHSHSGYLWRGRSAQFNFHIAKHNEWEVWWGCGKFKRKWIEFKASHVFFFENFSRCAYNVFVNRYSFSCVSQQSCQRGYPGKYTANPSLINHFQFHPNSCFNSKEISISLPPISARFSQLNPIIILLSSLTIFSPVSYMHVINIATKWDLDELVFSSFSMSLISNRQHATSTSCFFSPCCCTHMLLVSSRYKKFLNIFLLFYQKPSPALFPPSSPAHASSLFDLNKQPSSSFSRDFKCFHPPPHCCYMVSPRYITSQRRKLRGRTFLVEIKLISLSLTLPPIDFCVSPRMNPRFQLHSIRHRFLDSWLAFFFSCCVFRQGSP